ncbi:stAR-related lipid transfer protein 9-like [Acipenser oxyrinchus oxyrinchus]|uniref:StAR-related lipid transfer protein 9-like n=1 Tax=Acipenser oxyrinchus oxyrinchus TaxID=40147 RepID=A0AAD8FYW1_ACIOX|nr:stAR-related lipid transfer protein 9-like [Acipenser oxyrinchus oxyrinchus]
MANVKVAVRVRPLSKRESAEGGRIAVQVDEKVVRITNIKLDGKLDGPGDSREKLMGFGFDYCYWSVDPNDPNYSSQEEVSADSFYSIDWLGYGTASPGNFEETILNVIGHCFRQLLISIN